MHFHEMVKDHNIPVDMKIEKRNTKQVFAEPSKELFIFEIQIITHIHSILRWVIRNYLDLNSYKSNIYSEYEY